MNTKLIKIIVLFFIFTFLIPAFSLNSDYKKIDNLNFIIDFEFKEFEKSPANIDGRILLPMREFFETIGATVEWNDELKEINAFYEENKVFYRLVSVLILLQRLLF